jgi:Fe-S-cluster containining protein
VSGSGEIGPEEAARVDEEDELHEDEESQEDEEDEEEEDEDEEDDDEEEDVMSPDALAAMCAKCGGRCCLYYTVRLNEPEDADDFDEMRWFLTHEGNYIYVDDDEWHLNVISRCRFLDADARCTIYDHRPEVCRSFGQKDECEFTGEFDFEHLFETIAQLEEYAKGVLSPEELEKLPRFPDGDAGES